MLICLNTNSQARTTTHKRTGLAAKCHLGTHTHTSRQYKPGECRPRPANWQACSRHAGRLLTSHDRCWKRGADDDLRTLVARLAALVEDSFNLSWQPSPPAWAWHGGQQRERRRPSKDLQLVPASHGGGGTGLRHDLVVNKCVLTVGFWERNNVDGKGLKKNASPGVGGAKIPNELRLSSLAPVLLR